MPKRCLGVRAELEGTLSHSKAVQDLRAKQNSTNARIAIGIPGAPAHYPIIQITAHDLSGGAARKLAHGWPSLRRNRIPNMPLILPPPKACLAGVGTNSA